MTKFPYTHIHTPMMVALVQKLKHVVSHCKQQGMYLPINLCRLDWNLLLVQRLSADMTQVKGTAAVNSELKPHLFCGATIPLSWLLTCQRSLSNSFRLVYCLEFGWLPLRLTTALPQWIFLLRNSLNKAQLFLDMNNTPVAGTRLNVLPVWLRVFCTSCKNNKLVRGQCSYIPRFAGRNPEVNTTVPSAKPHFYILSS